MLAPEAESAFAQAIMCESIDHHMVGLAHQPAYRGITSRPAGGKYDAVSLAEPFRQATGELIGRRRGAAIDFAARAMKPESVDRAARRIDDARVLRQSQIILGPRNSGRDSAGHSSRDRFRLFRCVLPGRGRTTMCLPPAAGSPSRARVRSVPEYWGRGRARSAQRNLPAFSPRAPRGLDRPCHARMKALLFRDMVPSRK